mmetsp:Transcript_24941/g.50613  ORF Transcript_24941/g.50613 Transcript_24941/m.50613 type:complete len:134 (-) Transcript_24941:24-425(-)
MQEGATDEWTLQRGNLTDESVGCDCVWREQDCIMRWLGTKVYKQQAGCCPTCNFRVIAPAVLPPSADQPQTRSDPALRGAEHEPEPPGLALPPPISEPISSEIAPWARYTMLLAAGFAFFLFVTIAIVKAVMD